MPQPQDEQPDPPPFETDDAPLTKLANWIGGLSTAHSRAQFRASIFVKGLLVICGALLVAVAEGVDIALFAGKFSAWTITVFAGAGLAALGGFYIALTEESAAKAIEGARRCVESARFYRQQMKDFEAEGTELGKEIDRLLQLYNSIDMINATIQEGLMRPSPMIEKIIEEALENARNSLLVAFDFDIRDTWTICVYRAEQDDTGATELRCVGHERSIRCDASKARRWREGVGVAGLCYSTGNEVIVPDMAIPEIAAMFNLSPSMTRDYDAGRYRSIAAIPIRPDVNKRPWGVAIVTSDQPSHFSLEPSDGLATAQPIRAIAEMVALAVTALGWHSAQPTATTPPGDGAPTSRAVDGNAVGHLGQKSV